MNNTNRSKPINMRIKSLQFKRTIRTVLLVLLLGIAGIMKGYAYDFALNGIYYKITSSTEPRTVEVTYKTTSYNSYSGSVTIPSSVTYNGYAYSVTGIGSDAFENCSNMVEITIPNTIASIGHFAFRNCTGLQTVNYNATNIASISSIAWNGSPGPITVNIGNGVQTIPDWAFYNCSALSSVSIPNTVISIGSSAFRGCSSLQSITIPSSVTSIGQFALQNCINLNTLNYNAINCTISYSSSSYYHWLKGCSSLSELIVADGVQTIPNCAFINCSGISTVDIPNSVISIGSGAFENCSGMTGDLVIPNSVTSIGSSAFSGCIGLMTIDIPNSVTSVGNRAFYGTGLGSVFIPSSVETIGVGVFASCPNLMEIIVDPNNLYYKSLDGNLYDITLNTLIQFPGGKANEFTIPNGVTTIGAYAFCGCEGMTSIIIPNTVTSIGGYAFMNCLGITSLDLPDALTSIGDYAFQGTSLISITIKNNVSSIGIMAFDNCNSLTEVYYNAIHCSYDWQEVLFGSTSLQTVSIGEDVEFIPNYAFVYCYHLVSMTSMAVIPPTIENSMTLYGINRNIPVYIPAGTLAAYQAAPYWDEFTNFIDEQTPFHITVSVNLPEGGMATGSGYFSEGDTCTVAATANEHYIFVNWTENGEVVSTEAEYPFTVSSSRNLVANFNYDGTEIYTIVASSNPTGGGTVTGGGNYYEGDTCTLAAEGIGDFAFVNWTEGGEVVSTNNVYSFIVSGNRNLVANFIETIHYSITITANPDEGGTAIGDSNYIENDTCTLVASANEGYVFVNWTVNGIVISSQTQYSFVVTQDIDYVANFTTRNIEGAINGLFTVNDDGKHVYFSRGNLQYWGAFGQYWKFADHQ